MKARIILAICAAAAGLFVEQSAATGGNAISYDKWNPLCDIAKNLAAFYAPHKTALETALTYANDAEVHEYQLRVLTEMSEPETAQKLLPLLAAFNKNTKLPAEDITTGLKSAIDAATATAYLHGRIGEFLSIAADAAASGNAAGCLIDSGNTNPISAATALAHCNLEPPATGTTHPTGYDNTPAKLFGPTPTHSAQGSVTHGTKECLLTKAHSGGGLIGSNNAANEIKYAAGYFKITSNKQDTERTAIGDFQPGNQGSTPKHFHTARQAIHDYQQTKLAQTAKHTLPSAEDIKTNALAVNITLKHLLNIYQPFDEKAHRQQVNSKIDEMYGEGRTYSSTKLRQQMTQTSVPHYIYCTEPCRDEKLANIKDINHLRKFLTFYQSKRAQQLTEKAKELSEALASAKSVNRETSEDKQKEYDKHYASQTDCDAKNFCIYDKTKDEGKRCVYNETKATAGEIPIAQAQTGGTEATTADKCKDKKKDDCKDGCKWEGKTCKDSSFFAHKKLIMIAAIFCKFGRILTL